MLRALFALWVVIGHLIPWARRLQGVEAVPAWLYYFTDTIVDRLTQSSNELNPAVLCFIVLSGYCIHRNGLRKPGDSILPPFQSGVAFASSRFFGSRASCP
jgi:peptidoglycan/LPS O-acetylase OafA/YrhL